MIAIVSLLLVVTISIVVTRIATLMLIHTGLSRQIARFQARSAFTGSGFTTTESEKVVNHPMRRRIVMILMLLGNAGIVTAVSSLIIGFLREGNTPFTGAKIIMLIGGLAVLWSLAQSPLVDRYLSRLIERGLKRFTRLDVRDYASLMHLSGEYRLLEILIQPEDWLAGKTLATSRLRNEGLIVLGILRADGTYLGAPQGDTRILPQDNLIVYGRVSAMERLDKRRKDRRGDMDHQAAVADQKEVVKEEKALDRKG